MYVCTNNHLLKAVITGVQRNNLKQIASKLCATFMENVEHIQIFFDIQCLQYRQLESIGISDLMPGKIL